LKATLLLACLMAAFCRASTCVSLSGDLQTGNVGAALHDPLVVTVQDSATGLPVRDAQVYLSLPLGSDGGLLPMEDYASAALETDSATGKILRLMVLTDEQGRAGTRLELPSGMGDTEVSVQVLSRGGRPVSTRFSHVVLDIKVISFQMIGGLALFLLGMKMMSDGLQHAAGNRMKTILGHIAGNRFSGLLAGVVVTGIIQSSSATSVILVSFVNAGLMSLQQAIGVILGANIGTTVTGQLIAFKITELAFPMVALGFLWSIVGRSSASRFWGRVLLGLGILLLGMNTMKDGLDPLRNSEPVRNFFMAFSTSPFLGILAGTIVTCVIQSSSATVGLVMTLAGAGLITLNGAVYLVLGDNIGTTITAQLAAIGTNKAARRAAMAHTMFNLIGATYFGLLLARPGSFYMRLVESSSGEPMRQVANAHSLFNIFNAIVFLPLVPLLAKLCEMLVPGTDRVQEESEVNLNDHLLDKPALAVGEIERTVVRMARYTGKCVKGAMGYFRTGKPRSSEILSMEDRVDEMQSAITVYASRLFSQDLDKEVSLKLPVLLHTINDLERMSDQAVNMIEARERLGDGIQSSDPDLLDSAVKAISIVERMFTAASEALEKHDRTAAESVLAMEARLNALDSDARSLYTKALCSPRERGLNGLAILDFVNYCEKVGDHLTNIAQSVIGGGIWHGDGD